MFKWIKRLLPGPRIGDKIIYTDKQDVMHTAEINHIEPNGMIGITLADGKRIFPVRPGEWK